MISPLTIRIAELFYTQRAVSLRVPTGAVPARVHFRGGWLLPVAFRFLIALVFFRVLFLLLVGVLLILVGGFRGQP